MKKTLISSVNFEVYRVVLYTVRNTIRDSVNNVVSCRSVISYFEIRVYSPIRNAIADSLKVESSKLIKSLISNLV